MGKFEEGNLVRNLFYKKMRLLNTMTAEEIDIKAEEVGSTVIEPKRLIASSARDKCIIDYTETNANYLWINADKMSIENRYLGKIIMMHLMHQKYSNILSLEEITEMGSAGDIELAEKLGINVDNSGGLSLL